MQIPNFGVFHLVTDLCTFEWQRQIYEVYNSSAMFNISLSQKDYLTALTLHAHDRFQHWQQRLLSLHPILQSDLSLRSIRLGPTLYHH